MSEFRRTDPDKMHLVEDLAELQEVQRGERGVTYVNAPWGEIIEVTTSNSCAVEQLFAHAYATQYPDLFDGFNPEQSPLPTQDEIFASAGGPFGSMHGLRKGNF